MRWKKREGNGVAFDFLFLHLSFSFALRFCSVWVGGKGTEGGVDLFMAVRK